MSASTALIMTGTIAALCIALFIYYYNRFVQLRNRAGESWSGIEVQLKRRYDLIPNIVETVKGYMSYEKDTLMKVIEARTAAINASGVAEQGRAENFLNSCLRSLFALAEAYPDLKANRNFLSLQTTLSEIEEHIQYARRYYNAIVRDFNILRESFPSLLIAGMFGFSKLEFLDFDDVVRENVEIDLGS